MLMAITMLFACRVIEGRTEFSQVPQKLKNAVAKIIIEDFGMPEIVTEFGGNFEEMEGGKTNE